MENRRILTSQLPVSTCYELFNKKTIADATLDRLLHRSFRINLKGESVRKTRKKVTAN